MNLSQFCIKRPVFSTVLSFIIMITGLVGFLNLHTRFFPVFLPKVIMVSAFYPGASAELVESSVTTPLEEAISGVEGIDAMHSTSGEGESDITIDLKPGFDVYQVANKLRDKISLASYQLPSTVKPPTVATGGGSMTLMDIGVSSDHYDLLQLRDYLERYVIHRIEEQPGIASVGVAGANKYAMRIMLDPKKMAARHLNVTDITNAIQNNNVQLPAGKIKATTLEYPITAQTALHTTQQFENIIIRNDNGHLTQLKDVATVAMGPNGDDAAVVNIDGKPGVNLSVYNTTNGNPIAAADGVAQLLHNIQAQIPKDMHLRVSFNIANYMHASVHEVYVSIGFAVLCVILVIYLFLGNFRSTLIPIVTIPVCLIGTFGLIYLFGFTINVITLIALVLSIGLVVDDAIVMLENIYRHIEMGKTPMQAAIVGSKEITFAVIAMTLTLAAVYAPIGLVSGAASRVFESFAYTLAGAVIISGFIALTLSPMMCARLLKPHTKTGYAAWLDRCFEKVKNGYHRLLKGILKVRFSLVIIALMIAVAGGFLLTGLPRGFMPHEDMGFLFISVSQPSGTSIAFANQQNLEVDNIVKSFPAVATTTSFANSGPGDYSGVFVTLKPFKQRHMSAQQLATALNNRFQAIPGLYANAVPPSFGGNVQHQLELYIMASGSYQDLYQTVQHVVSNMNDNPGFARADTELKFDHQQYNMTVNRQLASSLNVTPNTVDQTVATLLGGSTISTFNLDGQSYDVFVQAEDRYLHSLDALQNFMVPSSTGQAVPLSNLIHIQPTLTQSTLSHYNRLRAAEVTAQLNPNFKLGQAIQYIQTEFPTLLPSNMKYALAGTAKRISDNDSNLGYLFLLAILFIYLVLAAQFESFLDPLIILLSVPLSIVSALAVLKLMNASLNIYPAIGLVTLIGLIAKHGILITQFANELQAEGKDTITALIDAASTRLRPILMTTFAMICGALPLILTTGASAMSRREIGAVIIVGLGFGTFFSLILVPITYSYAADLRKKYAAFLTRKHS